MVFDRPLPLKYCQSLWSNCCCCLCVLLIFNDDEIHYGFSKWIHKPHKRITIESTNCTTLLTHIEPSIYFQFFFFRLRDDDVQRGNEIFYTIVLFFLYKTDSRIYPFTCVKVIAFYDTCKLNQRTLSLPSNRYTEWHATNNSKLFIMITRLLTIYDRRKEKKMILD